MRSLLLAIGLLPFLTRETNIVLSNDDGWAEVNIRIFYDMLTKANNSVVLSAPADNRSGTGSSDAPAIPLLKPCEFNSCPAGSSAQGFNATSPRLNYVNSFPVNSMRYGIQTLSPKFFGSPPELAVAGFNVGANLGTTTLISGTVGAATEAAKSGIPAIAFSGTSGSQTGWTAPTPLYASVYADLSTNVTQQLAASCKPFLPPSTWLNVNFPAVSSSSCSSVKDFRFVLSRINSAGSGTAADVNRCGTTRLPTEKAVVATKPGCWASISVGKADTKGDAVAEVQAVVAEKLAALLSCHAGQILLGQNDASYRQAVHRVSNLQAKTHQGTEKGYNQCDETRPSCLKCIKTRRVCPGYTEGLDLVLRNQNKTAKAAAERRHKRQPPRGTGSPASVLPDSSASSPDSLPIYSPLPESQDFYAHSFFVSCYVTAPRDPRTKHGFLELLPSFFDKLHSSSALSLSLSAVAHCYFGAWEPAIRNAERAEVQKVYTKALGALQQALRDPQDCVSDEVLVAISNALATGMPVQQASEIWQDPEQLPSNPATLLDAMNLQAANVLAAAAQCAESSASDTMPPHTLFRAKTVRSRLATWPSLVPQEWWPVSLEREVIPQEIIQAGCHGDHCDIYLDTSVCDTWLTWRSTCLRVFALIADYEQAEAKSDAVLQFQQTTDDIFAAVPFMLGSKVRPAAMFDTVFNQHLKRKTIVKWKVTLSAPTNEGRQGMMFLTLEIQKVNQYSITPSITSILNGTEGPQLHAISLFVQYQTHASRKTIVWK
ncbi:MAG: hypothetical protein Q9173_005979, partial [Seirophora scorigena]